MERTYVVTGAASGIGAAVAKYLRERGERVVACDLHDAAESSMEHLVPRSKGGETKWENVVLADKRINNICGNRTLEEAGLTLKIKPHEPAAKPFHETVRANLKFPEWEFFVKKKLKPRAIYGPKASARARIQASPPIPLAPDLRQSLCAQDPADVRLYLPQ